MKPWLVINVMTNAIAGRFATERDALVYIVSHSSDAFVTQYRPTKRKG